MITLPKYRFAFVLMSLSTIFIALAPLFLVASCTSLQQTPQEIQARETLRSMTRGGVLPAEDAITRIEKNFPNTTAGSLAKIVHARIRMNVKDYAGAASLIDDSSVRNFTTIGDYALWLKASALEQAGRQVEARAAYESLARTFPNSLRAREAMLRDAQMLMKDGQAAAVPNVLDHLRPNADAIMISSEDAAITLIKAKAYEQTGDSTRAIANYRRVYFFAPASSEAAEAASAIARLGSSTAPANGDEADSRALGLFSAKRYSEAYDAYTDALAKFPAAATRDSRAFRVIAAGNSRRFPEAAAALNQIPLAERTMAMMGLAVGYGRARQWTQARDLAEELRRSSPSPTATWRT